MAKSYADLREFLQLLEQEGELQCISTEISPELEMTEVCRQHSLNDGGKALLFENVKGSDWKVAMNLFGSRRRMDLALGRGPEAIASDIRKLVQIPESGTGILDSLKLGWKWKSVMSQAPKDISSRKAPVHEVIHLNDKVNLYDIPVLKCWPQDAGPFVTLPLVFTKSMDGKRKNMGMYRLQIFDSRTTGMHWHIHKDGSHFFQEYKAAGKRMEVAVAIGCDPATVYSATAPLPPGVFEMHFAGYLRQKPVEMVQCKTVDLKVPAHAELVLEGYVDPDESKIEGPFGDHTGFYTPESPYPVFHVTAITHRKDPIYHATVVGHPPMEDCYLAEATEKIFLPLLQMIAPEVTSQYMPWEGCFHNCHIVSMNKSYPMHARKLMYQIWGLPQAGLTKILMTVSPDAPLREPGAFLDYVLERLDIKNRVFVAEGILDVLDHSSNQPLYGGKLGIDLTASVEGEEYPLVTRTPVRTGSEILERELACIEPAVMGVRVVGMTSRNPVLVIRVNKKNKPGLGARLAELLFQKLTLKGFACFVMVDETQSSLNNDSELLWRILGNMDPARDLSFSEDRVFVDASYKLKEEGYLREWPLEIKMNKDVVEKVKNMIDAEDLGL